MTSRGANTDDFRMIARWLHRGIEIASRINAVDKENAKKVATFARALEQVVCLDRMQLLCI